MRKKMNSLTKRGLKLVEDNILLKSIQSEIHHEISTPRFKDVKTGSLGDFKLEYDSPESRDIVLRRQFDSGEEIVVSALLKKEPFLEDSRVFPRDAQAKVCIKKPGLNSILQFDCWVSDFSDHLSTGTTAFGIERACFIRSLASSRSSNYGKDFNRNVEVHRALEDYLKSKGINEDLTDFLMYHLNMKEQDQYLNWLRKLESTISHSLKP